MTHNNSNKKPISATSTDRSVTFLKMHMGRILDVHTEKAGDVLTQILSPNFGKLCFTKFTYKNLCFVFIITVMKYKKFSLVVILIIRIKSSM